MDNLLEYIPSILIDRAFDSLCAYQKEDADFRKSQQFLRDQGKKFNETLSPAQYKMLMELEALNNYLFSKKLDFFYLQGLKDGIAIMKALASI